MLKAKRKIGTKKKHQKKLADLLLDGPVMSDAQFSAFKKSRKKFASWRTK